MRLLTAILIAATGLTQAQTTAPPPASYGINYAGRYRAPAVKVDGKLGPDAANQSNWNNLRSPVDVNTNGGGSWTAQITDQNGHNPIALTTTNKGAGGNDGGGPDTTNFQRLYHSGLRDGGGSFLITTKEPPFPGTYDVYVYTTGAGQGFGVNTGTTITWTSKSGGTTGTFDADQNYHIFSGLSGPLSLYCGNAIAGFSIVDPAAVTGTPTLDLLTIPLKDIDGKDTSLSAYQGRPILTVNVASKSGHTPQYKGLEALYRKYKDHGLIIVAFPCNDFGTQEPGTNADIKTFTTTKYQITFPIMEKIHIKGPEQHPLYTQLTGPTATYPGDVKWNFGKFLIGRDGKVAARYAPTTLPEDPALLKAIEAELAKKQGKADPNKNSDP